MATTATKAPKEKAIKTVGKAKGSYEASSTNFAVIKTGGKQYRVTTGEIIKIEKMKGEFNIGDKVEFGEVLLSDNGSETTLGTPTISGAKVAGEIVEIGRDAKVIIMRYKQKSRSGIPKNGHRQPHFKVKITAIA
ncbi:MAG: 50S ribosomal protein L21 [Patescibacteria group bacterium]